MRLDAYPINVRYRPVASAVAHVDETGLRVGGRPRLSTLRGDHEAHRVQLRCETPACGNVERWGPAAIHRGGGPRRVGAQQNIHRSNPRFMYRAPSRMVAENH